MEADTISYASWRFLWIDNPSMKVRWSELAAWLSRSLISETSTGDVPGFSMLRCYCKVRAKIIYNIAQPSGTLSELKNDR